MINRQSYLLVHIQASRLSSNPTAPRTFPDISAEATVGGTDGDLETLTRGMYEQGGGGGGSSTGCE